MRVLVDAETRHVGVADVGEQPLASCPGGPFKRRLDLLEGSLVANFDDAERLVRSEPVTPCIGDRLVMRKDFEEAVGVPVSGAITTPRQDWSMRIVRIRSSLHLVIFSRCSPAWTCSANLSMAVFTEFCIGFGSFE